MNFEDHTGDPRAAELERRLRHTSARMLLPGHKTGIGTPFLYALIVVRQHALCREVHGAPIETAATDGKRFYWNPDFLESLSPMGVELVLAHEAYHLCLRHLAFGKGKNHAVANLAADFVVHRIIADEARRRDVPDVFRSAGFDTIGARELMSGVQKERALLFDPSLRGDVLEVYERLMAEISELPLAGDGNDSIGGWLASNGIRTLDEHLDDRRDHTEATAELRRAAAYAKSHSGSCPAFVEGLLTLRKPQLDLRQCLKKVRGDVQEGSRQRTWSRFNRRGLARGDFRPARFDYRDPRWLVLLDTSGSMSRAALETVLSELTSLGGEGVVVPNDAVPHWDAAVELREAHELQRMRIVGGGGTDFEQFFDELPDAWVRHFDVLLVLTDGYVHTQRLRRPNLDVLWVLTQVHGLVDPPFGESVVIPDAPHAQHDVASLANVTLPRSPYTQPGD